MFYSFLRFKAFLLFFSCFLTSALFAQSKSESKSAGIEFRDFDSWDAVLAASKEENKPVFVDFFTTWCGPCKALEKDVYPKPEVGAYFNEHYISIKVQMDKTKKDNEHVQKWYPEIATLEKKYNITAYPTLIFLSPGGEIRNMYAGYMNPEDLINIAKVSLKPGQKYVDPTEPYYAKMRSAQKKGDGMAIARLVNKIVADENNYFLGRGQVVDSLTKISMRYFRTQPLNSLYTKDALDLIGRVGLKSNDPLFKLFYPNTAKVDRIVGRKNFGRFVVDRSILEEFFIPDQASKRKSPLEAKNVNWDSLYTAVKSTYNEDYAQRNIECAKTIVYAWKRDILNFNKTSVAFVEKYGTLSLLLIVVNNLWGGDYVGSDIGAFEALNMNAFCWTCIFSSSTDPGQLNTAIQIMKPIIERSEKQGLSNYGMFADTYANLLYKAGKRDMAIEIETKVIASARQHKYPAGDVQSFEDVLAKMKAGTPTWK